MRWQIVDGVVLRLYRLSLHSVGWFCGFSIPIFAEKRYRNQQ
jgi:hypothetical protein